MNITHDFSELWRIVDKLGAAHKQFFLNRSSSIAEIEIELIYGREVRLEDLEIISGLLAYDGRQVLLYIPDQGKNINRVLDGEIELGKKFHITYCSTLEDMKNSGRFQRYIATTDISGKFQLTGINEFMKEVVGSGRLHVCQNCLKALNYKQSKVKKTAKHTQKIFDLQEFFENYSSCFKNLPSRSKITPGLFIYPKNWQAISENIRAKYKWICSECQINLRAARQLLHVHHIDGVKGNVNESNLRVLCKACHRSQPLHDHLYIPLDEMKFINALRNERGVFSTGWPAIFKYADPACYGVLGLAYEAGWPPPKIEHLISGDSVPFEIVWPFQRVALSLTHREIHPPDWSILDLPKALLFNFGSGKSK